MQWSGFNLIQFRDLVPNWQPLFMQSILFLAGFQDFLNIVFFGISKKQIDEKKINSSTKNFY